MNLLGYRTRPITVMAALLLAIIVALAGVPTVAAEDFAEPEIGRHVYDEAGALSDPVIEQLESLAAEVEASGAPVVVYLRAQEANTNETLEDGRDLMESWDVQSSPDARNGVVIFLNLDPDDLNRGELALIAGEAHFDGGNLPQRELDRITSRMLDHLRDDDMAGGIATGLQMIASSLRDGPPPPPPPTQFESFSETMASGILSPLTAVAVASIAAILFIGRKIWATRPQSDVPATPVTTPPDSLTPAAAGALVTGTTGDSQIEATILDLARRNAVAFEPEDDEKKIRLQLIDRDVVENPVEEEIWAILEKHANSDGSVSSSDLAKVRLGYGPARAALQQSMLDSGWFDPEARSRRMPLYIAGILVLLLAAAALVFTVVSEELWGLAATIALALTGFGAIIAGASYPGTTPPGESRAQPWRGYLQGIKDIRKQPDVYLDLDEAVPYLVAMNATEQIDERLKRASANGYIPSWLNSSQGAADWGVAGFYPYWIMFHSIASPSAGGTTSAGASGGSGGSGGSF